MNQFSEKLGANSKLITVYDERRRRDCVSNKELSNEEIEKSWSRGVQLWRERKKENYFRDRTNLAAQKLLGCCSCEV